MGFALAMITGDSLTSLFAVDGKWCVHTPLMSGSSRTCLKKINIVALWLLRSKLFSLPSEGRSKVTWILKTTLFYVGKLSRPRRLQAANFRLNPFVLHVPLLKKIASCKNSFLKVYGVCHQFTLTSRIFCRF
ncbi:cytochrome c oxidase subunit 1 [Striga asiatica]|uniref:Cytochrome c oxidase subunit 1 n=1 Tax=Striga asiatica TaxID=4170 RepID=A0A5A7PK03_STRAF|nr:cytochrome c oxidase subunit 1 [Striga asiatica]